MSTATTTNTTATLTAGQITTALKNVATIVPKKPSYKEAATMRLTTTNGTLTLEHNTTDIATRIELPVEGEGTGCAEVNTHELATTLTKLGGGTKSNADKPLQLTTNEDNDLAVNFDGITVHLEHADYWQEDNAQFGEVTVIGRLAATDLRAIAKHVLPAAGNDETLRMLTGVNLKFEGDTLVAAATDRFRLSERIVPFETTGEINDYNPVLVPGNVIKYVDSMLKNYEGMVEFGTTGESAPWVVFRIGNSTIYSRILDADFVNYRGLIPANVTHLTTVNRVTLADRVKKIMQLGINDVALTLEGSQLLLRGSGTRTYKMEAEAKMDAVARHAGDDAELRIALNAKWLAEQLTRMEGESITLASNRPSRPVLILDGGVADAEMKPESFQLPERTATYLQMPIRLPE